MIRSTIADTGVLVGLIDKDDQWHSWVAEQAKDLGTPWLTCEAVIAEACHLLRHVHDGPKNVLELVELGVLAIDFSLSKEISDVSRLVNKYTDVPMDFADACLVRISELVENSFVFTVDSDFRIYRKNLKKEIPLIIPDTV